MSWITHRFVDFIFSLFVAVVCVKMLELILSWTDHGLPALWARIMLVVLTLYLWNPFKKEPPHNSGNNDLFPGV